MTDSRTIRTFHDSRRRWSIHQGDIRNVMPTLPVSLYDGTITDSPYGLKIMGHGWDSIIPPVDIWKTLLRSCKPGAPLLAFGHPKTFHRLACNIEDAGWEIRDTISWLFGKSMNKGRNIGKAIHSDDAKKWEGYSTTLKPAWEPILLAQKPRRDNFTVNALRFGCGGLNVKGCRIGSSEGRLPKNVILDEQAAEELDRQSGESRSRRGKKRSAGSNVGNGKTMKPFRCRLDSVEGYDDEGGASRFFYVAKAGERERTGNDHPTVKPQALCEYLARLILPPQRKTPRRLIVPFSGSGSEMLGALLAGWDHVTGIERDPHYVEIARRRLSDFDTGSAMPA